MVSVTLFVRGSAVVTRLAVGSAGLVGPNPVPYSRMISPGCAGVVVTPAIRPGGAQIAVIGMFRRHILAVGKGEECWCKLLLLRREAVAGLPGRGHLDLDGAGRWIVGSQHVDLSGADVVYVRRDTVD